MKNFYITLFILILPLLLLSQEGELDLSFNGDGKLHLELKNTHEEVNRVALQPDGKLLLVGPSAPTGSSGPQKILIVRLDAGGNPDPKFGSQGMVEADFGTNDCEGLTIATQADGKILVAGVARGAGNEHGIGLLRLMSNGQPDQSFGSNGAVYFPVDASSQTYHFVDQQPDGKIVVGGEFTTNISKAVMARFSSNGTPDYTFGDSAIASIENAGNYIHITRMTKTPAGKYAGVGYVYVNSQQHFVIVQFEANGDPDLNFGSSGITIINSSTTARGYGIAGQADGKVVVTGSIEDNGLDYFAIARLLADGTLDQSFGVNGQASAAILSGDARSTAVEILGDGKILAAGTAGGIWNQDFALARFTSAGTLDKSFSLDGYVTRNIGNGNDYVKDAILQPNGRIVVVGSSYFNHNPNGGNASTYDFAVARFLGGQGSISVDEMEKLDFQVYPNPASEWLQIAFEEVYNEVEVQLIDQSGRVVLGFSSAEMGERMDISALSPGMYVVKITAEGKMPHFKKIMLE